jgi:hypothetical protein
MAAISGYLNGLGVKCVSMKHGKDVEKHGKDVDGRNCWPLLSLDK